MKSLMIKTTEGLSKEISEITQIDSELNLSLVKNDRDVIEDKIKLHKSKYADEVLAVKKNMSQILDLAKSFYEYPEKDQEEALNHYHASKFDQKYWEKAGKKGWVRPELKPLLALLMAFMPKLDTLSNELFLVSWQKEIIEKLTALINEDSTNSQ